MPMNARPGIAAMTGRGLPTGRRPVVFNDELCRALHYPSLVVERELGCRIVDGHPAGFVDLPIVVPDVAGDVAHQIEVDLFVESYPCSSIETHEPVLYGLDVLHDLGRDAAFLARFAHRGDFRLFASVDEPFR